MLSKLNKTLLALNYCWILFQLHTIHVISEDISQTCLSTLFIQLTFSIFLLADAMMAPQSDLQPSYYQDFIDGECSLSLNGLILVFVCRLIHVILPKNEMLIYVIFVLKLVVLLCSILVNFYMKYM